MTEDAIWKQFFDTPGDNWEQLCDALDAAGIPTRKQFPPIPSPAEYLANWRAAQATVVPAKKARKRAGRRQQALKAA